MSHKKLFLFTFICVMTGVIFYSCDKDSRQPVAVIKHATLIEEVMHHQWTIPNIPVYLKKGATEFPGQDISVYDLSLTTNQAGNVQFNDLLYGNYYLYVKGWDPVFMDSVIGYKLVVINDSSAAGGIIDDRIFVSE